MTKENQAKYSRAVEALKMVGLTPTEFADLDMAMCFKTWEDDMGPMNLTVSDAMDMHDDWLEGLCARALKL